MAFSLFAARWLMLILLLPIRVSLSEDATVPRVEAANASEILDRYLRCYDNRTRPNVTGNPDIIYVSMAIKAFSEIKESNMEFQVFVYFRQYWTDKRLAHGTEATLMLGGTDVNRIWLPDTYINNANDHEVFEDNQLVLIDKNGQIVYFAYARIAAACQMKLVKFPMDVQQCHLTLESCKYETKTVGGVAGPTRVISSARSLWSKCLTFSLP
ncbi:hypothetical protein ABFA07_006716 [Porites harrisoni]